jgi:FkbM family methyltransferase
MALKWRFGNNLSGLKLGSYPIPDFIGREVCLDVGSNMGAFMIINKDRFDNFCFLEACYENFEQIQKNLNTNNMENAHGFNLAVDSESGKIVRLKAWIHSDKEKEVSVSGSGATVEHWAWGEEADYHPVLTVAFEEMLELFGIEHIDYMKIDCEGAEFGFLYGKDLSNIDAIGMELHSHIEHEKLVQHILKTHYIFSGSPKIKGIHNQELVFVKKGLG